MSDLVIVSGRQRRMGLHSWRIHYSYKGQGRVASVCLCGGCGAIVRCPVRELAWFGAAG